MKTHTDFTNFDFTGAKSVTYDTTDSAPSIFGFVSNTAINCTLAKSSATANGEITTPFTVTSAANTEYSLIYGTNKLTYKASSA